MRCVARPRIIPSLFPSLTSNITRFGRAREGGDDDDVEAKLLVDSSHHPHDGRADGRGRGSRDGLAEPTKGPRTVTDGRTAWRQKRKAFVPPPPPPRGARCAKGNLCAEEKGALKSRKRIVKASLLVLSGALDQSTEMISVTSDLLRKFHSCCALSSLCPAIRACAAGRAGRST